MPRATQLDSATVAAYELTQALLRPRPPSLAALCPESMQDDLLRLATIFQNSILSDKRTTDHVNHPIISDNDVILSPTTFEDPILPPQSQPPPSPSLQLTLPAIDTPALVPRVAPITVVLQPPQPVPRVDPPVPATYSHLTRNPGQRRRENKKNRPDLGRTSFPSPNPLQSDQESITNDLEDNFSTTDIIPSPTPIIAPPLLPITTIPHSATTSPFNSPNKLPS